MDFLRRCGAFCATSALSWCSATVADDPSGLASSHDDYQLRRLMLPTPSELASEKGKGRVYIYDSLESTQVDAALDTHFDRIQNMMFIRIQHLPPTGSGPAEVEDDGC
jgi:hypothetical protein